MFDPISLVYIILLIVIVAVILKLPDIGGKPAQIICILVALVAVAWILSIFGLLPYGRGHR